MNIMKEAHKLTREIKKEFPNVDYKFQLGLCISYLHRNKEAIKMVDLKGTEKQVNWANDIREDMLKRIDLMRKAKMKYKTNYPVDPDDIFQNRISSIDRRVNEENFKQAIEDLNFVEETILKVTSAASFIMHKNDIMGLIMSNNYKSYRDKEMDMSSIIIRRLEKLVTNPFVEFID